MTELRSVYLIFIFKKRAVAKVYKMQKYTKVYIKSILTLLHKNCNRFRTELKILSLEEI